MRTILITDDDPNLRLLVSLTVDITGYEILEATNGKEVLQLLETRSVDLVVLDWMMPGMSGIEVARALRADPKTAQLPIVMLTAKTQKSDLEMAAEAGVQHYLIKPFSPIELLETVERVLGPAEQSGMLFNPPPADAGAGQLGKY